MDGLTKNQLKKAKKRAKKQADAALAVEEKDAEHLASPDAAVPVCDAGELAPADRNRKKKKKGKKGANAAAVEGMEARPSEPGWLLARSLAALMILSREVLSDEVLSHGHEAPPARRCTDPHFPLPANVPCLLISPEVYWLHVICHSEASGCWTPMAERTSIFSSHSSKLCGAGNLVISVQPADLLHLQPPYCQ